MLDFGCGMGNLAVAAARNGCTVVAMDASCSAISHLRQRALAEALPIEAIEADLRNHAGTEDFDCVISIGLLMFFDCATTRRVLSMLQAHVRPGGIAVIDVLVEGTTYLDMFEPGHYCLFPRDEMASRFAGGEIMHSGFRDFEAPSLRIKSFVTFIARKPRQHSGQGLACNAAAIADGMRVGYSIPVVIRDTEESPCKRKTATGKLPRK